MTGQPVRGSFGVFVVALLVLLVALDTVPRVGALLLVSAAFVLYITSNASTGGAS